MPLGGAELPFSSELDPSEDPPGSIDPLGTLALAERLGELLLPGFTARMSRARLLTFATVASVVAERAVARMNREDLRLTARLAFERLFVASLVRMAECNPKVFGNAVVGVPGNALARRALQAQEPLTDANFLKGQAVNGPFGVMARLARHLELIDHDGRPGRCSSRLLMAWADDEQLPGVLDEKGGPAQKGAEWMDQAVERTVKCIVNGEWPSPGHRFWKQLAEHLRPNRIRRRERRVIVQLLEEHRVRRRVLEVLRARVNVYHEACNGAGSARERQVLLRGVRPMLTDDPVDRLIALAIDAIDAYEEMCGLLQEAFDSLIWGLKVNGGQASSESLIGNTPLRPHLENTVKRLGKTIPRVDCVLKRLSSHPDLDLSAITGPMTSIRDEVLKAQDSVSSLAESVLCRHERVQKDKKKAPWIERSSRWTLMPGENRVAADGGPPVWVESYLHPFKIINAYAMLTDLGQVNRRGS